MKKTFVIMWLLALWLFWYPFAKNGAEKEEQQPIHTGSNTGVVATTKVETWGKANTWETVQIISGAESSKYLRGYTWDTVVITKENSGAVVIQSWDELLYRNEVYWFQVKLWKEWKWGKICKWASEHWYNTTIEFYFSWATFSSDAASGNAHPDKTWCTPYWYEPIVDLRIYDSTWFKIANNEPEMDGTTWWLEKKLNGKNNIYYFYFWFTEPDNAMKKLVPSLKCYQVKARDWSPDLSCPWWEGEIITKRFSAFNLK